MAVLWHSGRELESIGKDFALGIGAGRAILSSAMYRYVIFVFLLVSNPNTSSHATLRSKISDPNVSKCVGLSSLLPDKCHVSWLMTRTSCSRASSQHIFIIPIQSFLISHPILTEIPSPSLLYLRSRTPMGEIPSRERPKKNLLQTTMFTPHYATAATIMSHNGPTFVPNR